MSVSAFRFPRRSSLRARFCFGAAGGTVLILIDALFMSLRLRFSRRIQWKQIVFNASAGPVAVWLAAQIAGITPLFETDPGVTKLDFWFVAKLAIFTTVYFFLISWLLTIAIALQRQMRPYELWTKYCRDLLVNYGAGGSIGALLVYNTRTVDPIFVAAIIPLLILLFLGVPMVKQKGRVGTPEGCRTEQSVPVNNRSSGACHRRQGPGDSRPHSTRTALHDDACGGPWGLRIQNS